MILLDGFQLSYWEKKTFFSNIDLLVVGSGIVGLNAAWTYKKTHPQSNVLIVEKSFLPYGASTRNAGFACFGSLSELIEDEKTLGEEKVLEIVEKRIRGLEKLRKNLGDKAIGYAPLGGYELFREVDTQIYESCLGRMSHYNVALKKFTNNTITYEVKSNKISSFGLNRVRHLLWNNAEGQIDTGMMMQSLINSVRQSGVNILNGIFIEKFEDTEGQVKVHTTAGFEFSVNKLIITTNAFATDLIKDIEVEPARAQVLITSPIANLKINGSFHFDKGYYYFRNIDNRLLIGGGRNIAFKEESTTSFGISLSIQNKLEEILSTIVLPNERYKIEQRWSGIMGLGPIKLPIIKQISNHVFCAIRLSGMGIAIGSEVGEEVALMAR